VSHKDTNRHAADAIDNCWKYKGVWGDKTCPELVQCRHCYHCDVYAQAGRRLFDRKVPEDYARFWTSQLAEPKEKPLSGCISVLVFRIGGEWFALKTRLVSEVLELRSVHSIPHRNNSLLRGLINVHGELQLCVAMGPLLAVEYDQDVEAQCDSRIVARILLLSADGESLAFHASEVACVHSCHPDELEPVPATLPRERGALVKGLFCWEGQKIALLDDEILFEQVLEKIQ